ncbi:MAG: S1C family serine protease [Alphaproteobacteria bacterium]|nr:S1C family serine protease [Alphaproteobacteria bacterium]
MTSERWAVAVVLAGLIGSGACTTGGPPEAAPVGGESSSLDPAPSPPPAAPPESQTAQAAPPALPPEPIETVRETVAAAQASEDVPTIPVAAAAETPPEPVDVLALVDLQRDGLMGSWTREGSSLATPAAMRTVLLVPQTPPEDYRWSAVVERLGGHESLNFCLAVGGRQTMVVLEGFGSYTRGLNLLDGRPALQNATTTRGQVFRPGVASTIVCTVRRAGAAHYSVQVECDGRTVVDWTGDPTRLSLDGRFWDHIPGNRLAVAIYDGINARFRISHMKLESVSPLSAGGAPAPLAKSFPSPRGTASATEPVAESPEAATRRKESVALIDHPMGAGTGFVVGQNLLATNAHVVGGSFVDDLVVHFATEEDRRYRAKRIVFVNDVCDLALLEVVGMEREAIPLVAELAFQRGQPVVIIGNPSVGGGGIMVRNAVTQGTITALMRIGSHDFYQIEAAVNPGSSGGPVLNHDGELVAVVAMKATDRGADEIRSALKQLDDSFRAHFDPYSRKGIAFGVPASALSRALKQVESQTEEQADRIHGRQVAKSLFRRMTTLGAIHLLELQVNVSPEVRQQAVLVRKSTATRRIPGPQPKLADLMPERTADSLRRQLNSEEVRKLVRLCSANLDERLDQLQKSGQPDAAILDSLANLLRTVKSAKRAADSPASNYQAYSKAFLGLSDDLRGHIERLEDQLAVERFALDD